MIAHKTDNVIKQLRELAKETTEEGEEAEETFTYKIAEHLAWLKNNVRDFEKGDLSWEDSPLPFNDALWITKCVGFGMLWEREYPDTEKKAIELRLRHSIKLGKKYLDDENLDKIIEEAKNGLDTRGKDKESKDRTSK